MTFSNKQKGFTLIEATVGSAVFLIIALTSYKAFGVLMDAVLESQAKIAATEVANERFEIIRNLPYVDVGISGGLPVGRLQRSQTVIKDNYNFTVLTTIRSVDDPFDGTIGGTPGDTSPADYKLADLDISCNNCKIFTPLKFTTLVAPFSLETAATNGALFMQVIDSAGVGVSGASLHVVNTQTNPDTIIDETTDTGGWFKIVDAVPGTNAYNITATKSGYSQDQTYLAGGAAGASPNKPDSTVVAGQITQVSFAIDKLSTLNVSTVNASCVALPSIGFS
ncbi:prepilin-type N-terminal cleavage/methylation domain-containing protein, partial [Patescibacteria group bacterium]|nr:prepilin-type N-terminal cleavage/methylation domain-containing protein [Patescibacteria group bacterium]